MGGHRNVYGSPLDKLFPGSSIILENQSGTFTYAVDSISTTSANDWSVTLPPAPNQRPILTLLTCTIPHTRSRVILKAFLS